MGMGWMSMTLCTHTLWRWSLGQMHWAIWLPCLQSTYWSMPLQATSNTDLLLYQDLYWWGREISIFTVKSKLLLTLEGATSVILLYTEKNCGSCSTLGLRGETGGHKASDRSCRFQSIIPVKTYTFCRNTKTSVDVEKWKRFEQDSLGVTWMTVWIHRMSTVYPSQTQAV